ncbi:PhnA-like protein [Rhizobium sp. PL01]|uniref:PhnA-like protein n=1 Tax=Rhizobium sp. PL01 TaxID=3085631 RepID=UPI003991A997
MTESVGVSRRADVAYSAHLSDTAFLNKVSWGAVFAGVALALCIQFMLSLLGVGIGSAVIDPATSDNPAASTFSIVSAIWFVAAGMIAAFSGGYIASRLSGRPSKSTGSYHGLASWAATTLIILYLLTTSLSAIVGGAFSGIGSLIGGVGQTATTAVTAAAPVVTNANNPFSGIEQQIRSVTGGNDPQALRDAAVAAVQAAISGDQAQAEDARNRAAEALARAQGIPVDQAKTQVIQYEAQYKQSMEAAKQKAIDAAQATSKVVSTGAILAFFALLFSAISAWFGGAAGTINAALRTETLDHIHN